MRRVVLSTREKERLEYLQKYSNNSVERNRSLCLLLSNKGYCMSEVASQMNISPQTVKRLLDAWEQADANERFSRLRQAKGQGAKQKLKPITDKIPELLENHNRNLNLVLQEIETQYGIKTCKSTLQNFLKDTELYLQTRTQITERQTRSKSI